ncbi:hypothetical protein P167DRAFT_588521 [Morchella conica CCBAS932]|uniref:DDE Tnp4 domain-containing protein n=1 Tax=Morchella conica CCBAS932 TaxID=1392247 RepID=A0A3N4KP71_9PEZI|nr:hypothetical protein P167DRAFT_588521 [Morchella conica CCBAS932]
MQTPELVEGDNHIFEDGITALCMLLARLSWPNRLADLYLKFDWKPERVSRIRWKHLLVFDVERLTPERLVTFTIAIQNRGAPLETCFGFIDCTLREIARPIYGQEAVYNGWKRKHCLKYQAVVTPDGIIIHLYGPVEGTKHDALNSMLMHLTGQSYYGDPAYPITEYLLSPFAGAAIGGDEQHWNRTMSKVRIIVEWCFKEVLQMFSYLDFTRSQKILSPIGIQYPVAVLLHNTHICLHRPQISQYFAGPEDEDVPELFAPPSLEEYFHYIE